MATVGATELTKLGTLSFRLRHIDPNRHFITHQWPMDNIFTCALLSVDKEKALPTLKGFNFKVKEERCHLNYETPPSDTSAIVDTMYQPSLP